MISNNVITVNPQLFSLFHSDSLKFSTIVHMIWSVEPIEIWIYKSPIPDTIILFSLYFLTWYHYSLMTSVNLMTITPYPRSKSLHSVNTINSHVFLWTSWYIGVVYWFGCFYHIICSIPFSVKYLRPFSSCEWWTCLTLYTR